MALSHFNITSTVTAVILLSFIFAIICLISSPFDNPNTAVTESESDSNNRLTMFLPLHHSPPPQDSTIKRISLSDILNYTKPHRPTARMPLHDDLILNGYYSAKVYIGTPPQKYSLIVDTGSTVTHVPCSTCTQCGNNHEDPKFDPKSSSTYEPLECNLFCVCDKHNVQCTYDIEYAEMSTSGGVLGEDIVSFGNQSELKPQRAIFGCANVETGDLSNQKADGILGLGRGEWSIVDQLVNMGVISNSFSLCYGGMGAGGGAMVLGGISPPTDMIFADFDPTRSSFYYIELTEIHVAGKQLSLNPSIFDGKHGTILDSGTTYAYIPPAAYSAFKDAIIKELHSSVQQVRGPNPKFDDICFSASESDISNLYEKFPAVEMVFGNGQKLYLSPENYMFRFEMDDSTMISCLGVFPNGKDQTSLLGGIIVRNTLVMYDRENKRIGFWKTNCSEIWERLKISDAPPQVPQTMYMKNSTVAIPPALAPMRSPTYHLPGESEVGSIIFSIFLDIKYSSLKDRMAELAQFIAHELYVNPSQVHLLNFSSNGNNSATRWAIFPDGSADSIPIDVATSIASRIAENNVHLPETFGKYQFSEWKVEPPHRRSGRQQNNVGVFVTVPVLIFFGLLSAFGIWFVRKPRRQSKKFGYKPVNTFVPEQELQPL